MVFLPNFCVNLRACLCGVVNYASAQALDFLDLGQKSPFLDWKHQKVPIILMGIFGWALISFHPEAINFRQGQALSFFFTDSAGAPAMADKI